jgi:hypothetical protein
MVRLPRIYFEEAEEYTMEVEIDRMERYKQEPFTRYAICYVPHWSNGSRILGKLKYQPGIGDYSCLRCR